VISIYHLFDIVRPTSDRRVPQLLSGAVQGKQCVSLPYTTVRRPPMMLISSTTSAKTNKM